MKRLTVVLAVALASFGCAATSPKPASREVLVAANRNGGSVSLFDVATWQKLATIPVGDQPHEVAISSDGRLAFISNYDKSQGKTISIIDVAAQKEVRRIDTGELVGPHGMHVAGNRLFFTAEKSGSVAWYDLAASKIGWSGKTGAEISHMLAVSPDQKTIYTANIKPGTLSVIPLSGGKPGIVEAVPGAEGIAISPDGREVWIGSRAEGGIAIFDTALGKLVAKISEGEPAYRLAFSADGARVYVPRGTQVVEYDAKKRSELRRIDMPGFVLSVLPSPDGRRLYSAVVEPELIVGIDLESGKVIGSAPAGPVSDGIGLARID
jgi:YVTN family beta-propeller protein